MQADLLSDVPAEQQEKELSKMVDDILNANGLEESKKYLKEMQVDWIEGDYAMKGMGIDLLKEKGYDVQRVK